MAIKVFVKEIRSFQGISQRQLAKLIGISRTHLQDIESGESGTSVEIGLKLALVLKVDINELFKLDMSN